MAKSLEVLAQKANKLYAEEKYKQAKEPLKEILALQPNNISVMGMLAFAENKCGNRNISHQLLDQALSINPNHINSYDLKGFLCAEDGNYAVAESVYKKALSLNPNMPAMQKNLGMMYFKQKKFSQAIRAMALAVVLQPDNKEFKQLYTSASADCTLSQFDENDKNAIIVCLQDPVLSHKFLTNNWTIILYNDLAFKVLRGPEAKKINKNYLIENEDELKRVLADLFVLLGLRRNYISSVHYEEVFTHVRQSLLDLAVNDAYDLSGFKSFLVSLAMQSWLNEYVFSISAEEEKWIEKLKSEVEGQKELDSSSINKIALLANYMPMHGLQNIDEILRVFNSLDEPLFKDLVTFQVLEPLEEKEIRKTINILDPIHNSVSSKVRDQYEENPYPRWRSINNDLKINVLSDKKLDILIAGCGTGQEPASMTQVYPNAHFFCVDLSLSSIAYAIRQVNKINLSDRMEFMQADILDLEKLQKKFDVIYSSGVLHHMEDPEAGLKVLKNLLKPGGKMYISLYSEAARKNVVAARQYIEKHNIPSTTQGIRQMRAIIKNTEDKILKESLDVADFFTLSQCRDLLFHVQEHRFTLPQVKEILERHDLKFGGMFSLSGEKLQRFQQKFSGKNDLLNIDKWHVIEEENPDLFSHGMYNFIFQKI